MIQMKSVLFPTDFTSCSRQALPYALFFSRKYHAELHMMHAIVLHDDDPHNPAHHFPDTEKLHALLKETAAKQMSVEIDDNDANDLKIKQVQERGISAAPMILEYASSKDIDLIVSGTHGRRGLGHLLLGSVAEEVVRLAPCPVLTIREREEPKAMEAFERILVPVDFSNYSMQALLYAKQIAASCDARLQLLHIVEDAVYPVFYRTFSLELHGLGNQIAAKSKEALEEMFNESGGPDVPFNIEVLTGNPPSNIDTDLIVIATHGLTGLEHLLIGSVAEKVVRQAPCPVFTVKAFGKSLIKTQE
jgi:nucleotide-binding universal stress UspA family protein